MHSMRRLFFLVVTFFLCAACASSAEPTTRLTPEPLLTFGTSTASPHVTNPAPRTVEDYLMSLFPPCGEIKFLDEPVVFDWPNIQQRLKELEDGDIGYFTCPQPPDEVYPFIETGIVKPPYNFTEINRVERPQGTLDLYYHSAMGTWLYVWVVPMPGDAQTSLVVVAESDASEFTPGECRLILPATKNC